MKKTIPTGATHVNNTGVYYKLQGKFWFVNRNDGWYAISGKPLDNLKELK